MSATVPLATPEPLRGLLSRVVDGPGMCERLQRGLADLCPVPFRIVECVAKPARSRETLKQKRTLRVNYRVVLEILFLEVVLR